MGEFALARNLYHRPEVHAAVVAVLDRLEEVIHGLFPMATDEQVRAAFDATENTLWGGMVLKSVPLDELRDDGNLRELMSAVLNAMIRNGSCCAPDPASLSTMALPDF
ncbi:hypothetical protein [Nocardia sp. NPDC057440]|uniref:hypothetical protein n=1 Tax=Nocardia sp. NPDC057440 TaxID=3346134 RepID=UPI00366ABFF2